MALSQSVLVVDESEETPEVLRTALAERGTHILRARAADQALEIARRQHPAVIVLDLEVDHRTGLERMSPELRDQAAEDRTPVIVLGTMRRLSSGAPGEHFMSKPYHYGPLIQKIESLLESARPTSAAS